MSEVKHTMGHTPGPWEADIEDVGTLLHRAVIGPRGELVADCDAYRLSGEETAANARLIAAAPDLLDALHELLRATDFDNDEPWIVKAHAAISKATGAAS